MKNKNKTTFYFVIFSLDSGFPGLHAWANNYSMIISYIQQWVDLEPILYEYETESNNINSADVQNFIEENIHINMDNDDKLITTDVTPFQYYGNNPFILTNSQIEMFNQGYYNLEAECCEVLISSLVTLEMISQYIRAEPMKELIKYIWQIPAKRFIVANGMDVSSLPNEARRKLGLADFEKVEYYGYDELVHMDYIIMKAICGANGKATKTSRIGWDKDE